MINRIYTQLLKRAKENNISGQFDLNMKNGDEVTIYLPGRKVTKDYSDNDYSILTDNNEIIHFNTLSEIAEWIDNKYCA